MKVLYFFFFFFIFSNPLTAEEKPKYKSYTLEFNTDIHMFTCQEEGMDWGTKMQKKGYDIEVRANTADRLDLGARKKSDNCSYFFKFFIFFFCNCFCWSKYC